MQRLVLAAVEMIGLMKEILVELREIKAELRKQHQDG